jgi:broad specificity polyphosphatase/5'/3'-nucleotidase SurE
VVTGQGRPPAGAVANRCAPGRPGQSLLLKDPSTPWCYEKAPDATDLAAVDESCIAVTPLKLDMTDKPYMTRLAGLFE